DAYEGLPRAPTLARSAFLPRAWIPLKRFRSLTSSRFWAPFLSGLITPPLERASLPRTLSDDTTQKRAESASEIMVSAAWARHASVIVAPRDMTIRKRNRIFSSFEH